jgi:hypothetical protein
MKTQLLAGGVATLVLLALAGCASSTDSADALTAHQYKYVATAGESTASTSSPLVGKNRVYARTHEEMAPVIRRIEPPPPRPPVDPPHPHPRPSK